MAKLWGIWIPKLEVWLEENRSPYVTTLRREAVDVIKNDVVNPKGYEVREYEDLSDAGDGISSTSTGPR